jgi:hypothetical protein
MPNTANAVTKLRYLGPFERFLWLVDLTEPMHFAVAAQFECLVSIDKWEEALRALQQRHPLLRSSIKLDENSIPFFCEGGCVPIPLRVVDGNKRSQVEAALAAEIARPFGTTPPSLIRATLLQGVEDCSLILTLHHAIADGLAAAYLVRDLSAALDSLPLMPLNVPPSHEGALRIVDDFETIDDRLQSAGDLHGEVGALASSPSTVHPPLPQVALYQFSSMLSNTLRSRARKEKTSVTGAIASALVSALARCGWTRNGERRANVALGTSKRAQLGMGEQCAMYASGVPFDTSTYDTVDFWDRARDVKQILVKEQAVENALVSRLGLNGMLAEATTLDKAHELALKIFCGDFVISNLGVLPLEGGGVTVSNLYGPALLIGARPMHMLGVGTVGGQISVAYSSRVPIAGLLEQTAQAIAIACQAV